MLGGGGGGCRVCLWSRPISVGGGRGSKGLLPCFLVPKGNQPTACTLALWWLKFGPTEIGGGGEGGGAGGRDTPPDAARIGLLGFRGFGTAFRKLHSFGRRRWVPTLRV